MKAGRWKLGRRGATLVLVTTIGVIVGILAMAMIQLGYHARMLAVRSVQGISARCAADAGLAEALYRMQCKLLRETGWDSDTLGRTDTAALAGNAQYTWNILGSDPYAYEIRSTGTLALSTKTVHAAIEVGSYWDGVGVEEEVQIFNGGQLNVSGPYAYEGLDIRSNTESRWDPMSFKVGVHVPGDVLCGPEGDPNSVIITKRSTVIDGEVGASDGTIIFPPVQEPADLRLVGGTSMDITRTTPLESRTLTTGRYEYDSVLLRQDARLMIAGDVVLYARGGMIIDNNAVVVLSGTDSSLELYLGDDLVSQNSSFNNTTADARNLKIYGLPPITPVAGSTLGCVGCDSIILKATSDLYAAVYAPQAAVTVDNSGNFTGGITAHDFFLKNSGNFTFDSNLRRTNIEDPAAMFIIGRWWED
jgi:hypothetical protein